MLRIAQEVFARTVQDQSFEKKVVGQPSMTTRIQMETHRKLSGDGIESYVHSVLEIRRIRDVGLGVAVQWFRTLDLALQRLLLPIEVFRFCRKKTEFL